MGNNSQFIFTILFTIKSVQICVVCGRKKSSPLIMQIFTDFLLLIEDVRILIFVK